MFLFCLVLFAAAPVVSQTKIEITLKNNTPAEIQTKAQLERLIKSYDLTAWTFTTKVQIDEKAIPHSHPVLTLHTRHSKDDDLLLATYVHEQIHWHMSAKHKDSAEAFKELEAMFPNAPEKFPEGAGGKQSTYVHIFVCYLEMRAMRELVGELRTKQVMDYWATDHYTWIYKTVVERPRDIGGILFKHKLLPSAK